MKKRWQISPTWILSLKQSGWIFGPTAVPRPLCSGNRDLRAHRDAHFQTDAKSQATEVQSKNLVRQG